MKTVKRDLTVSVVIPTIPPRGELLARAMLSVAEQTLFPLETIVQIDTEGMGAGPTRNLGWRRATGDYIAFLDDDDEFKPDHLEECMKAARREKADVVYPWFDHIGWPEWTVARPDPLATVQRGRLIHPFGVPFGAEQAQHMRKHAFIPATIVVRRDMLERVGGYPHHDSEEYARYNQCEDWALLIRLLDAGAKFVHVPKRTWKLHHGAGIGGQSWKSVLSSNETD